MIGCGVDSHCHVFEPSRFPYPEDAVYRPAPCETGSSADLRAVLAAHGLTHAVLVNPTNGYGYDNRCMAAAVRSSGGRFRGIARVRPDSDEHTLVALAGAGVIGIRLDLISDGVALLARADTARLLARVREMRWQVHVQCERDQLAQARPALVAAKVPLVFDHCGRPDVALGVDQPGFRALLDFGRDGHHVKLSGPFRFHGAPPQGGDVDRFVAALLDAFTVHRCVFGSDWPFIRAAARLDYGPVLANLERWLPDPQARRTVLWDTPARLFGFAATDDPAARAPHLGQM